ncbi:MAG TPA: hypothetical protein VLI05_05245 [Candidatus Saccharimonadia bacterium]|nr:hypothetical protein [Candidatus Saccharimonadia bacterium]
MNPINSPEPTRRPAPKAALTPISIERYVQQAITPALGEYRALRVCVPTCFFMLAKANGYLSAGPGADLVSFCRDLDWPGAFVPSGWVRPRLAADLRRRYGIASVSWLPGGHQAPTAADLKAMKAAGYLGSRREVAFFRRYIIGHDLPDIVRSGYPVIAGVLGGFGANKDTHAVIIVDWTDDEVEIVDPDDRNPQQIYPASYVRQHLNQSGGGFTVVLPARSARIFGRPHL